MASTCCRTHERLSARMWLPMRRGSDPNPNRVSPWTFMPNYGGWHPEEGFSDAL